MKRFALALFVLLGLASTAHASYVFLAFRKLPAFIAPTSVEDPFDGTDRLFVTERAGRVYVFQNDPTTAQRTLFLDIADSVTTTTEGGLLDIVFHPQYESNRYFYVTYTRDTPRRWILARFTTSASNPSSAPRSSELRLIDIPKVNLHHNGGCLEFGADGYLYVSLGDDGNTAIQNAQNLGVYYGKVLRIDVNNPPSGKQYGIPPDNPFVSAPPGALKEIWAFGFRNPWRFSFDPPTGRLWLADVGADTWEEIDIVKKGRNYGWPRLEANACYFPVVCDTAGLNAVPPLFAYPHTTGESITGGFVYRGPSMPSLAGKYIYADYITHDVSALTWDGINPPTNQLLTTLANIASFGVDKSGELFMTSYAGSAIYRLFQSATSVDTPALPAGRIASISPNPFQSTATIAFSLETDAHAVLEIYDVAGHRVATLANGRADAGAHAASWNGRDANGAMQASGVYLCRLVVDGQPVSTRRVILIK